MWTVERGWRRLIRVLNIITDTNIGGAGKVLLNYLTKADRAEFDHTVIVPEGAQLSPFLRALDIPVIEIAGIADQSFRAGAVSSFRREFKHLNPDIIHTHASLSARIAAKLRHEKCVVIHTRHSAFPQGKLKTSFPVKQILGAINNHLSDIIIAVSPAAGENLTDTGTDPEKIVTIFNGVEPVRRFSDNEKSAVRSSLGIKDGVFICAVIARLVPEKGHEYVLDAADILRDLPIRFIIAGSGPAENELRAAADKRELDNCVFTGFVGDIAAIENIMDLQLNASYGTEASSLSLIEGMSLGVPAVASDYGGNPYVISNGENGVIVPMRDSAALAGAVRKLYTDTETVRRMGDYAIQTYNARFTADIMTSNLEQTYRSAIARLYD